MADFMKKMEKKPKEGYIQNGIYIGDKGPTFGTRHVQILLLIHCVMIGISTKASFAVQIVAMTAKNSSSPNPDIQTYAWSDRSVILSSFFWTYVISNIFAAPLEKKYGPKWFLLGAIFMNCVAFTIIPLVAQEFGSIGVLVCRLVQGLGQGFMWPTQQVILGLWAPAEERSTAGIAANTGNTIGIMLSSILPGFLSETWWGWPSSFYILGALGLIWSALYLIFGQNSPATHPRITPEEKRYIQLSLNQNDNMEVPTPFRAIISSIHVWAALVAQIGVAWSNNMAMTEYSSFLDKVMEFNIKSNGLYSSIAPAVGLMTGLFFGPLSDYITKNKYMSIVNARRIFHMTGAIGIAASAICLSYLDKSQKAMSIALMVFIYISQSAMACGNVITMIDLSPRFAGIIFGISNASGQSIALFAPLVVQFFVSDEKNIAEWRIVFMLTAAIVVGTSLFFVIFASGERQIWDGPEMKKQVRERRKKISVISMSEGVAIF